MNTSSKRAYGNGYTSPKYDESLLRHFYRFMVKDVTDIVYRRSHTIWRNYISARAGIDCRRCETCKSYITDVKAKYCYHCGSETRVSLQFTRFQGYCLFQKKKVVIRIRLFLIKLHGKIELEIKVELSSVRTA